MRPYSCAVLASICHGPSISLPRHQNFTPCGCSQPCARRRSDSVGAAGMVAVLDQVARGIAAARAEVDRQHRLDVGGAAPVDEFVGAELVGLGRHPGEIEPARPLVHRADAVLPVVAGDEVAAGIAHDGRRQLAHQRQHVAAEALGVGGGMAGLEDAAIDAAAEMLDEGAEQARIGGADRDVAGRRTLTVRMEAAPLDGTSGDSTELLSSCEYGCCGLSSTARAAPLSTTRPWRMMMMRSLIVVGGGEVVGDVDDRHAGAVAQAAEQVDDRHAQRGIDHRHRLVGDDQRRPRDQRARDGDALQLAARQLVRKASPHLGQRQADLAQRLVGGALRCRPSPRGRPCAARS